MPVSNLVDRVRAAQQRRTAPLVLELDLTEEIIEAPPRDPVAMALARRKLILRDLVDTLHRAAADPRVRAVIAKVGATRMSLGRLQEIREAVVAFRESGKPAVAWAETFGEFGPGSAPYYLATGFGEIWIQPSGDVGLIGPVSQTFFPRGTLQDKLGIEPQLHQRHEYKNAGDQLMQREFTPAHREAVERLVQCAMDQLVDGIAAARNLEPDAVRALVDRGPLPAGQAREAGLIDRVGYRDEVYASVLAAAGEQAQQLYLARYGRGGGALARRMSHQSQPVVGLVYATGPIRQGRSRRGPGGSSMGSDTICAAIRAAVADEKVRAVVLRVDSPGGSYVASDAVWREVVRARESGMPFVVSMGDVAASGGYYISMAADAIVAQPATITGSIGVVGGKLFLGGLLDRLGTGHGMVSQGANAELFTTMRRFTDADWQMVDAWLDRVYDDFVGKVAAGRNLAREQAHEVARGRVWTGVDARDRGLVDELGGLRTAVGIAAERAGLAPDPQVRMVPRLSPLDRLLPPQSSEDPAGATARVDLGALETWGPVAHVAARLGLQGAGPLMLPPEFRIRL